jgi:probable rRNA maturation factor
MLRVLVVKGVRAPVAARFIRGVLVGAASEPLVAARLEGVSGGVSELTVRVTGDRELRRLNARFLGLDEVTDVLSFPSGDVPQASGYLGDIALSWPAVVRQASQFGHSADSEAALLCVHGLLHLLGWDHAGGVEEGEMVRITHACLRLAGVAVAPERLRVTAGG